MVLESQNWIKIISIPFIIISATGIIVLNKFMYEMYGRGDEKYLTHTFYKPWFQTTLSFIGMACTLIVYEVSRKIRKIRASEEAINTKFVHNSFEEKQQRWIFYVVTAIPGLLRVISTVMLNISLLYLNASIVQAFQSTVLIYIILMEKFFKRKKMQLFHWVSLILSVVATGLLIASAVLQRRSTSNCIIGIFLIIFTQIIRSATYLLETSLFRTIKTNATLYIGLEGLWGFLIILTFAIPIFNISSTPEGNGLHEDLLDTIKMIGNNLLWVIPEVFVVLLTILYAISHSNITSQDHPQRLPFLEACSAFFVWLIELIIYYSIRFTDYGLMHPLLGEKLSLSSIATLFGYLIMAFSVIVYSRLLPLRWLYPQNDDEAAFFHTQRVDFNSQLSDENDIKM